MRWISCGFPSIGTGVSTSGITGHSKDSTKRKRWKSTAWTKSRSGAGATTHRHPHWNAVTSTYNTIRDDITRRKAEADKPPPEPKKPTYKEYGGILYEVTPDGLVKVEGLERGGEGERPATALQREIRAEELAWKKYTAAKEQHAREVEARDEALERQRNRPQGGPMVYIPGVTPIPSHEELLDESRREVDALLGGAAPTPPPEPPPAPAIGEPADPGTGKFSQDKIVRAAAQLKADGHSLESAVEEMKRYGATDIDIAIFRRVW